MSREKGKELKRALYVQHKMIMLVMSCVNCLFQFSVVPQIDTEKVPHKRDMLGYVVLQFTITQITHM